MKVKRHGVIDDTTKEMQKRTDDTLREIARLIAAEGEKTRQTVKV